ncbi:MAG: hypothetical protein QM770_16675 [Tepidisphaeraceae bacterium]
MSSVLIVRSLSRCKVVAIAGAMLRDGSPRVDWSMADRDEIHRQLPFAAPVLAQLASVVWTIIHALGYLLVIFLFLATWVTLSVFGGERARRLQLLEMQRRAEKLAAERAAKAAAAAAPAPVTTQTAVKAPAKHAA